MKPYRALTKDGKMVYGWYFYEKLNDKHYILVEPSLLADYRFDAIVGHIEVIPESVAQQVGRQDKNKNEIYEGDVVHYKIYMGAKQEFPIQTMVWIWSEYHCGFSMKVVGGDRYVPPVMIPDEHEIKIIGNIHQNPKLLEKP